MPWTAADTAEFERKAYNRDNAFAKGSLKGILAAVKSPTATKATVQAQWDLLSQETKRKYRRAIVYLQRHYPGVGEVSRGNLRLQAFNGYEDATAMMDRAEKAMTRCLEVVQMCQKAVAKVIDSSPASKTPATWSKAETKATELFKIWLDDSRNPTSVARVRMVFASMEQALRNQVWEVVVYGTAKDPDPEHYGSLVAGAYAFVIPSENAYRIYLGSSFWRDGDAKIDTPTVAHAFAAATPEIWQTEKKIKSALDAAVVTTVHELCHIRAISGTTAITDVQPNPYDWKVCKQNAKTQVISALTNAENYAMFGSSLLMESLFF